MKYGEAPFYCPWCGHAVDDHSVPEEVDGYQHLFLMEQPVITCGDSRTILGHTKPCDCIEDLRETKVVRL